LLKDGYGQTSWHKAPGSGNVETLRKVWCWAKEIQINPEELRNGVFFLKGMNGKTAWHMAEGTGNVEVLEMLWDCAKKLQLKLEEI
jgi:hypothetical protein